MKRSILTTFAVLAIAASATFAQYYGYWSPVKVFEPAVSTNVPGDWDQTFTLVYRISVNGDAFAWTPDIVDDRADPCGDLVKQAQIMKIRDTGYLFIKFASDVGENDYCSDSDLPWSWVCAQTQGIVNVVGMWIQLDSASPWQTPEGPTALPLDEYIMYAALQAQGWRNREVPSFDWTPIWTPNFNWDINWGSDCAPKDPCWDLDWEYIKPATALLKIYAAIDPESINEWAVIDLISGSAPQRALNGVIGRQCCTAQVFVAQTFKGGMISMGAPDVEADGFSAGYGQVTDWYNEWENCPEDLILCLDLRLDTAMTQAHNVCEYTPDEPGGGCAPGSTYTRGGFSLW